MTDSILTEEVIPSASRLMLSMRELGYDFPHAVADLIDNSIAADASQISIDMKFIAEDSWFRIADNGIGMSRETLKEAMRFGTERDYKEDELGKFGLGLKTASLSQCSRFTVCSRLKDRNIFDAFLWDLKHVESTNRWEIINVRPEELSQMAREPLNNGSNTVVLWENLDRVLGYKVPWGEFAKRSFLRLIEEVEEHIAMVFHRFLSGETRHKKKIRITINDNEIMPWDPFVRDEQSTEIVSPEEFEIHSDNGPGIVRYAPFILPSQGNFSSLSAFNRSAGPNKWNYQQGFYIYRADRLVQSGGWSRMRAADEHTKLARVALDFWPDLDSAFDINVAKARVNLPAELKDKLKPRIEQLVKRARGVYSQKSSINDRRDNPTGQKDREDFGEIDFSRPPAQPMRTGTKHNDSNINPVEKGSKKLALILEAAAERTGEMVAFQKIKRNVKIEYPEIASEMGW